MSSASSRPGSLENRVSNWSPLINWLPENLAAFLVNYESDPGREPDCGAGGRIARRWSWSLPADCRSLGAGAARPTDLRRPGELLELRSRGRAPRERSPLVIWPSGLHLLTDWGRCQKGTGPAWRRPLAADISRPRELVAGEKMNGRAVTFQSGLDRV